MVNALSEWMWVEVRRDGQLYRQDYETGVPAQGPVERAGRRAESTGTKIQLPSRRDIFPEIEFDFDTLRERFREYAFLTKGVWLRLRTSEPTSPEVNFYFEGGIQSFVRHLNEAREVLFTRPSTWSARRRMQRRGRPAVQRPPQRGRLHVRNCINTDRRR